jgi:cytochrome c-type biogenesis protein CcmH
LAAGFRSATAACALAHQNRRGSVRQHKLRNSRMLRNTWIRSIGIRNTGMRNSGMRNSGMRNTGLILLLIFSISTAHAVEPDELLADAALEARARNLSTGLRCLVCQNQSIDDSSAPLARDLRLLVRERLKSGETDTQVMRFITDRYGDFVLLRPPVGRNTLLLWATPVLLLLAAGTYWWRRRQAPTNVKSTVTVPLSAAEQRRLDTLLDSSPER